MALPARNPDLGFQPGDHVCAFYNGGGSYLDDLVVDFVSEGLRAGNTTRRSQRMQTSGTPQGFRHAQGRTISVKRERGRCAAARAR